MLELKRLLQHRMKENREKFFPEEKIKKAAIEWRRVTRQKEQNPNIPSSTTEGKFDYIVTRSEKAPRVGNRLINYTMFHLLTR